jgi:hypothetical protein
MTGNGRPTEKSTTTMMMLIVISLMAVTATSCLSVQVRPVTSPQPVSGAPERAVIAGKGFGITSADNGRVIKLDADIDVVRLVLEDDVDWRIDFDQQYLELQQSGPLVAKGFTAKYWLFRVLRIGKTLISATGVSACSPTMTTCETQSHKFAVALEIGGT